jgi:hypothetical protein
MRQHSESQHLNREQALTCIDLAHPEQTHNLDKWGLRPSRTMSCLCATYIYHSHVSILGLFPSHFIHAYGTNPTSQKNHIAMGAGAYLDY